MDINVNEYAKIKYNIDKRMDFQGIKGDFEFLLTVKNNGTPLTRSIVNQIQERYDFFKMDITSQFHHTLRKFKKYEDCISLNPEEIIEITEDILFKDKQIDRTSTQFIEIQSEYNFYADITSLCNELLSNIKFEDMFNIIIGQFTVNYETTYTAYHKSLRSDGTFDLEIRSDINNKDELLKESYQFTQDEIDEIDKQLSKDNPNFSVILRAGICKVNNEGDNNIE